MRRMGRRPDNVGNTSFLDTAPCIHHEHAFSHLRDSAHIMGDQDDGRLQLRAQIPQQGEDLRLNSHVKRCCRLVSDKNLRLAGKRDGNHHTLPLAAGKLMRIVVHPRRRIRDPHRLEKFNGSRTRRRGQAPALYTWRSGARW